MGRVDEVGHGHVWSEVRRGDEHRYVEGFG